MAKKMTYDKAMEEIESILTEIESSEINVDSLTDKVKRVTELVQFCKTKLRDTEVEINHILDSMEE